MGGGVDVPRSSSYPMVEVAAAVDIVLLQAERVLEGEHVGLEEVAGRVLFEDVLAQGDVPPFRASVKDGYAVVQSEGPGIYDVSGEVTAGERPVTAVGNGKVAYVTTGAPVPDEADAVVQVEWTKPAAEPGKIEIYTGAPKVGHDIRPVGRDVRKGQTILSAGEEVHMAEVGLLATCNVRNVRVYKNARVAVLSTGDELVEAGGELGFGKIVDSNRPMLLAAVGSVGGIPVDLGIAADEEQAVTSAFMEAMVKSDVLITSGGVSMGNKDFIKPLLAQYGTVHFGRVMMKPGKPLTFATIEPNAFSEGVPSSRKLVIGLPGNPVSCFVCFHLVVSPLIRKLSGFRSPHNPRVMVRTKMELKLDPERPEYHRALVSWDVGQHALTAVTTGTQASSRLLSARSANGLLVLPRADRTLPVGEEVEAILIGQILR
mmetsp:Transcript_18945/g.27426  ORF Transcript_18945/g.27426 Transcript_18945/m.27426 type:complete len:430 (-) Transcript_18945:612-1901(-)